ncbi:SDR family NAD(P)-dependent oxidoreductase [Amphibiibacter pelophylacis]|uniref:SDR family NAD(P)-dependent oxidoreductase n=1 Tax=Amphibiibacter pelophylacis TaxID=1799477 RepID=A0ACC6NYT3_9BURK
MKTVPETATRWVILTGASRGLGLAMAQQLLAPQAPPTRLLTLSRHPNLSLAAGAPHTLTQWASDLSDPAQLDSAAQRLALWLDVAQAAPQQLVLINNAARLASVVPLEHCPPEDLAQTLTVGLHAPMRLTAVVLAQAARWREATGSAGQAVDMRVLNISSGLGRRPMAAQSPYCAVKAGLDLFSRCVALEQAALPHPGQGARIVALAPGVVDTAMQGELRGSDPAHFPDRERFVQLQKQSQLDSPEACAGRILRFLDSPGFGEKVIADIREDGV